jgi:hypothetical protein
MAMKGIIVVNDDAYIVCSHYHYRTEGKGHGEGLNGRDFIARIEEDLVPVSPIMEFAIRKQLADLGLTEQDLTPQEAMRFIDRMTDALDLFLGRNDAQRKRKFMISLLRKQAPEYFEGQSPI